MKLAHVQKLHMWVMMKNKLIIQLVNLFLDIAENNTERNITMCMED